MKPWETSVNRVVPYVSGDQPKSSKLIGLNTDENPYPPAPGAERAIREMDTDRLHRYPDPTVSDLVEILAEYYEVGTDQIFVGVGSDDVIAMSFLTFFNSPKPVSFLDITCSFYKVWADLYRIPYETPKLGEDFSAIPRDYKRENGGVIFPNPNAPTGVYMPLGQVEGIIEANQDAVVIVDEAYIDFASPSTPGLIGTCDNLLMVRALSKFRSMTGLRIDFAVGNPALIEALNDMRYSYNSYTVDLPSTVIGVESVKGREYFEDIAGRIATTRGRAKIRLGKLGFIFPDSRANFIFTSYKGVPAAQIFEALEKEQIYVRYFDGERLDNSPRIGIRTDEEMETLLAFLERFLGEQRGMTETGRTGKRDRQDR